MDDIVNLPEVGQIFMESAATLTAAGYNVSPLTWRDVGGPWPYPFLASFSEAISADSVGMQVSGSDEEGRLVFFKGGFADLEYWAGPNAGTTEPVMEAPEATSTSEVRVVVEGFVKLFVGESSRS